jgi:hypothetical protein
MDEDLGAGEERVFISAGYLGDDDVAGEEAIFVHGKGFGGLEPKAKVVWGECD